MKIFTFVCSLLLLLLSSSVYVYAERPLPGWYVTVYENTSTIKLNRDFKRANGSGSCEVTSNDVTYKNLVTYSTDDGIERVHIYFSFPPNQKPTQHIRNIVKYVKVFCGVQPASNLEAYVNNKGKNANF